MFDSSRLKSLVLILVILSALGGIFNFAWSIEDSNDVGPQLTLIDSAVASLVSSKLAGKVEPGKLSSARLNSAAARALLKVRNEQPARTTKILPLSGANELTDQRSYNHARRRSLAPTPAPADPIILTEEDSTRAIALESPTFAAEPFSLVSPIAWGPDPTDHRTRVVLFTTNVGQGFGDVPSNTFVDGEDGDHRHYPFPVEEIETVPNYPWLTAVVIYLSASQHTDARVIGHASALII
jgi:hypothetical protein